MPWFKDLTLQSTHDSTYFQQLAGTYKKHHVASGFRHILRVTALQKAVLTARCRHRATVATAGGERRWATAGDGIHSNREGGGHFLVPGVWRFGTSTTWSMCFPVYAKIVTNKILHQLGWWDSYRFLLICADIFIFKIYHISLFNTKI